MQTPRLIPALCALAIISGCGFLLYLVDDGLGLGWPPNVVRNWQDFGLLACHGKLVFNPGGFEALTHPQLYQGMSPVSLYLAFVPAKLFAWTGQGLLVFHLLLAAAVFWAIHRLTGRDRFAFLIAAAALLSPGYTRWQKILDPNTIPVLLGIPYAAAVVSLLGRPRFGAGAKAALLALTLAFTLLNWTSAWMFTPLLCLLLGMPGVSRRSLFWFAAMAGTSCFLFAAFSFAMKVVHPGGGASVGVWQYLGGYTWGHTSYGAGMTTGKAIMRLGFVNAVALLPLLLAYALALFTFRRQLGGRIGLVILPVLVVLGELAFMRNYFAHHPWMSSALLLAGIVFSLAIVRAAPGTEPVPDTLKIAEPSPGFAATTAIVAGCFLYGLAVLAFYRANSAAQLSLINLVRQHTARSDCITIVSSSDPETALLAARLDEMFDRRVAVAPDAGNLPRAETRVVILSRTAPNPSWKRIAQSAGATSSSSLLQKAAAWFNRTVARRNPGDRLELADMYFLYEAPSGRTD